MLEITAPGVVLRKKRSVAFTLIELLTVIAVIAILASLILAAGSGVVIKAKRSRASAEVQALSGALEAYKTDNGVYPAATGMYGPPTTTYPPDPVTANVTLYQASSEVLYAALTGTSTINATPVAGTKSYISLKSSQIATITSGTTTVSYFQDPWKNPYGYSTTGTSITTGSTTTTYAPNNGSSAFDLWSTGGTTGAKSTDAADWLSNWQ